MVVSRRFQRISQFLARVPVVGQYATNPVRGITHLVLRNAKLPLPQQQVAARYEYRDAVKPRVAVDSDSERMNRLDRAPFDGRRGSRDPISGLSLPHDGSSPAVVRFT